MSNSPIEKLPITGKLKQFEWIADLPDDWDGEGSYATSSHAWNLLVNITNELDSYDDPDLFCFNISPNSDGSLDLLWDRNEKAVIHLWLPSEEDIYDGNSYRYTICMYSRIDGLKTIRRFIPVKDFSVKRLVKRINFFLFA